jgi:putative DNA primase/helicase
MKYDVAAIKAQHRLSDLVSKVTKLTKHGPDHQGLCPFHSEKSPSFTVTDGTGLYYCFGCGASGDAITFVSDVYNLDFKDACAYLGGELQADVVATKPREIAEAPSIYADLKPAEHMTDVEWIEPGQRVRVWNHKQAKWSTYKPTMVFPYLSAAGDLLGYVLRLEINGKKITPTVRWGIHPQTGELAWIVWPFDEPRPLYGLDKLKPEGQVLVVEGEKATDAARRMLPLSVVSWPGGGKGVKYANWAPLAGRSVVIWGDADAEGEAAANEIAAILIELGCTVKVTLWDKTKEKGWDAADAEKEGWKQPAVISWLKEHARPFVPASPEESPGTVETLQSDDATEPTSEQSASFDEPPPHQEVPDGDHGDDQGAPAEDDKAKRKREREEKRKADAERRANRKNTDYGADDDNKPFRALGYNKGTYYFFSKATQQVVSLTASQCSSATMLLQLADINHWEQDPNFAGRSGVDWLKVANDIMKSCHARDVFSPHRLRGRGAWADDGRSVVHLGPTVLVDGVEMKPANVKSDYIYERTERLEVPVAAPASKADAMKLVEICRKLVWQQSLSGDLLAGWMVIAPVCGILKWRPHIWITGESGSGKSTVFNNIINQVVGPYAMKIEGTTTEAGIRQGLGIDARPVLFDEAEGETAVDAMRVQNILSLARVSSSGGKVSKGSTNGVAVSYEIRAAFAFSSINTGVQHRADDSRITRMTLLKNRKPDAAQHFRDLTKAILETLTTEYAAKLFARSVEHLDTLRQNAEVFSAAAARVFGSQREADQVGPMIAGLYLCHSDNVIDIDDAEVWIRKQDWISHAPLDSETDEQRLVNSIVSTRLRINVDQRTEEYPIMQLLQLTLGWNVNGCKASHEDAHRALSARGIRVFGSFGDKNRTEEPFVVFSNTAKPLKDILRGTPWQSNHAAALARVPGAYIPEKTYGFACCPATRVVALPGELFRSTV